MIVRKKPTPPRTVRIKPSVKNVTPQRYEFDETFPAPHPDGVGFEITNIPTTRFIVGATAVKGFRTQKVAGELLDDDWFTS